MYSRLISKITSTKGFRSFVKFVNPFWVMISKRKPTGQIIGSGNEESYVYAVIAELREMRDGWSGTGTLVPSDEMINSLNQVLLSLGWEENDIPDVQVDDDGSITLIWRLPGRKICSVDINRDGQTVCIFTDAISGKSDSKILGPTENNSVFEFFNKHGFSHGDTGVDPEPKSSGRVTHEFGVISDLKRMANGWAGPNTVAPNSEIIESVNQLIVAFGWTKESVPDFLIDPDNGTILIIWNFDEDRVCAIDIYKDGGIKCAVTSISVGSSVSRTYDSSNCEQLVEFVNSDICFDGD